MSDYYDNFEETNFVPDYEEELLCPALPGSTSKSGKKCPVCPGKFTHVHRHVTREHLPWFIEPHTACWECQLNFGRKNALHLHIEKEHNNESNGREFNSSLHLHEYISNIDSLLDRFKNDSSSVLHFINNDPKFKNCEGCTWHEEDLVYLKQYFTNQVIPKTPYPVKHICSILHWRILANILNHPDTSEKFPNAPVVPEVHSVIQDPTVPACKEVAIVGSSIVYWAKRAIKTNQENLGLPVDHVRVDWYGRRGMKWKHLLPKLREISTPAVLCVHLGSNDIGSYRPNSLSQTMKNDIVNITEMFPDTCIVF